MVENEEKGSRRRDPRYVEHSSDLSDWIQVRIVRQFGTQQESSGVLVDLTPRAVKVGIPGESAELRTVFGIGTRILITFRFRDLATTTATASVARIDDVPNGVGLVLFFDFIREEDRETITRICQAFNRTDSSEPDSVPPF